MKRSALESAHLLVDAPAKIVRPLAETITNVG